MIVRFSDRGVFVILSPSRFLATEFGGALAARASGGSFATRGSRRVIGHCPPARPTRFMGTKVAGLAGGRRWPLGKCRGSAMLGGEKFCPVRSLDRRTKRPKLHLRVESSRGGSRPPPTAVRGGTYCVWNGLPKSHGDRNWPPVFL